MELQRITKRNITKITGLPISDLLGKKPVGDVRLKKLQRQQTSGSEDLLVRGNPQLTMGRSTPIKVVDAYFDNKERKVGGKSEF